jgi:hypothetical protein
MMALLLVTSCTDLIPQPQSPGAKPQVKRGTAHILESGILRSLENSLRFEVRVRGTLPTPCHELDWEVSISEERSRVLIEVFSLYDPDEICIQVEETFDLQVPLGDLTETVYSVWVNDEPIGTIDLSGSITPSTPTRDASAYVRGQVYIDRTEIILLESYPVQVRLNVVGNLPTPCHELEWDIAPPDGEGRIAVEIYSITKVGDTCIQVLEPFDVQIPVGDFTEGSFSVWLNGEMIGEFDL